MYTPPAFRDEDRTSLLATIRAARLATFITATAEGPLATPLPLFIDENEGEHGVKRPAKLPPDRRPMLTP